LNPAFFLIALSFCLLIFRFHMPFTRASAGEQIRTFRVPIPARVRLQRANVYGVGAVMVLGGLGGWLPLAGELLLAIGVMAALMLPLDYRLTDQEIALGRSRPRKWSEFRSIEEQTGRVVLKSDDGRDFTVWLPGATSDRSIVADIRRLVQPASEPIREVTARSTRKSARNRPPTPRVV